MFSTLLYSILLLIIFLYPCLTHTQTLILYVFICVPTEALIGAINNDIEEAKVKLELPEHLRLREDNFFTSAPGLSLTPPTTTASTSHTIINGHWQLAVTAVFCTHTGFYINTRLFVLIKMSHSEISQLSLWLHIDIIIKTQSLVTVLYLC